MQFWVEIFFDELGKFDHLKVLEKEFGDIKEIKQFKENVKVAGELKEIIEKMREKQRKEIGAEVA